MAMTLPPPVTSTQPVVVSVPVEPATMTTGTQIEKEEQVSPSSKPQTLPVAGVQPHKKAQAAVEQGADSALKVVCKQEDLARGISLVYVAVLEHSTLPILQNLLITTDQGRLRISSTNLEIGVQVWIDADIQVEGTTVVHADRLRKLVATLPKERVTISVPAGSQTMTVTCPGTKTTIRSAGDPREFPSLPVHTDEQAQCVMNARTLKAMIAEVEFATESDIQAQPVRSSIKLSVQDGALTLVGADTLRLCERIHPLGDPSIRAEVIEILVPAKDLTKLASILPPQGDVSIFVTEKKNQVVFHLEQGYQVDFSSRLMTQKYMNYKRALPKGFQSRVVANTKQLMLAVERSALFAVDTRKSVRCVFAPSEQSSTPTGTITLDADDASVGDSVTVLEAEVTGPKQVIFFHVTYLLAALAHIESPQVSIEINETGKPVVVKPIADVSYLQLLQTQQTNKTSL